MALILKSICFNDDGNSHFGSLHCRKNAHTPVPPKAVLQEGVLAPVGVFVPADLSGGQIHLSIEVQNTGSETMAVQIFARELPSASGQPPVFGDATFNGASIRAGETVLLRTALNPGHLAQAPFRNQTMKLLQKWQWSYASFGGLIETDLIKTVQTVYILFDTPVTAPWCTAPQPYAHNEMQYVWTSLLDIACSACDTFQFLNGHRPSTPEEHLNAFEHELYFCKKFHYDITHGASYYVRKDAALDGWVKLQAYLEDRTAPYTSKLNCTDCASLVAVTALACGIPAATLRMQNPTPGLPIFGCNEIISIGFDTWEVPFGNGFSYHEVATALPVLANPLIFDACLALDSSAFPGLSSTVQNKNPELAGGMLEFSETPHAVVNVPTNLPYQGLFYRERLVADGQACSLASMGGAAYFIAGILTGDTLMHQQNVLPAYAPWALALMARFGFTENPCPQNNKHKTHKPLEIISLLEAIPSVEHCTLKEQYGASALYTVLAAGKVYRIELEIACNESEAWLRLLTLLASVASPHVQRISFEDAAFVLGTGWLLFATHNFVFQLSSEDGDCPKMAALLAQAVSDALE